TAMLGEDHVLDRGEGAREAGGALREDPSRGALGERRAEVRAPAGLADREGHGEAALQARDGVRPAGATPDHLEDPAVPSQAGDDRADAPFRPRGIVVAIPALPGRVPEPAPADERQHDRAGITFARSRGQTQRRAGDPGVFHRGGCARRPPGPEDHAAPLGPTAVDHRQLARGMDIGLSARLGTGRQSKPREEQREEAPKDELRGCGGPPTTFLRRLRPRNPYVRFGAGRSVGEARLRPKWTPERRGWAG